MVRSVTVKLALLGLTGLLVAAPLDLSGGPFSFGPNVAAAKPGNGKGRGHGLGHGLAAGDLEADGVDDAQANADPSNGHSNGRAVGHIGSDAISGVEQAPPGQAKTAAFDGTTGNLGVKGSFNAIHSAAIDKGVVSPNSRVAKVKAYLDAAQNLTDVQNADGETNEADLQAAIEAAALAAAKASSQPVTADMLDKVNAYSNERGLTDPGIDVDAETQGDVADRAQEIQSGS